ncbi:hypothetical protein ACM66B_003193 [Microbotryomycetes sp. NB124-2]
MTGRVVLYHLVRTLALVLHGLAIMFATLRLLTSALDTGAKVLYSWSNNGCLRLLTSKLASTAWRDEVVPATPSKPSASWQIKLHAALGAVLMGLNWLVGVLIECIEMVFGHQPARTATTAATTKTNPTPTRSSSFVLKQARIVQLRQKIAQEKAKRVAANGSGSSGGSSVVQSFWSNPRQTRFPMTSTSPVTTPTSAHQTFYYGQGFDDAAGEEIDWLSRKSL